MSRIYPLAKILLKYLSWMTLLIILTFLFNVPVIHLFSVYLMTQLEPNDHLKLIHGFLSGGDMGGGRVRGG